MLGRARGFTLIEILVSIVVIGILMSAVMVSFNVSSGEETLRDEARRLMSLIELAQDDAMLQGREFGLEFTIDAYRFVEYDPYTNQWAELVNDNYLQYWSLPENIELDLFLEDQRVLLDQIHEPIEYANEASRPDEAYAPHLLIFSSGDATPFELHLLNDEDEFRAGIQGDLLGNLEIMTDEDFDF